MNRPYFKLPRQSGVSPWHVDQLCTSYGFPIGTMTGRGVIGIVELGGGYDLNDIGAFFSNMRMTTPTIVDVSVDPGAGNSPGTDADIEVVLDISIAGAVYTYCTGQSADIRVYFANNDAGGIGRAITAAANDKCDVFSISWGADEAMWGLMAAQELEKAAATAVQNGMVVFAASGDNDSSDGGPGATNVDFPAAAPHVIGCGGTRRVHNSLTETVWNNNPGLSNGNGTGGGFSTFFRRPNWTIDAPGRMRMVPDVVANADPMTGYHITFQGKDIVVGGTSAVAPFYAGAVASVGQKLGFISRKLWKHPTVFSDIVMGDNGAYRAGPGPDPCTGLGTPYGAKLLTMLEM